MNRHIILTNGRSGSNYLANVLNLHPEIVNYGEVLGNWTLPYKLYTKSPLHRWSVNDYLTHIYHNKGFFYAAQLYSAYAHFRARKKVNFKKWHQVYSIGIKEFFLNFHVRNAQDFLKSDRDLAIVYLYRENILRRYLSVLFLRRTQVAATEKSLQSNKIFIDVGHMIGFLKILENETANERKLISELPDHRLLTIRYEDYFTNESTILAYNKQVFEFLGVKPIDLKSQQRKILSDNMRDLITNYDEFHACLMNTPYQRFLEGIQ